MREIEFREIFRHKCTMCGCKNKVHSELMNENDRFVGYSLKCCKCGKYEEFLLDEENNGKDHRSYRVGRQSCIMPSPSFCNRYQTKCKLPKLCPHWGNHDHDHYSSLPSNKDINRKSTVITEYVPDEPFL